MIGRLPRRLVQMRIAQVFAILLVVFGPVANVGGLQSMTNDCLVGCPCDAEEEHADDPCDDEHGDDHVDAPADECGDDCEDCDCDRGVSNAVAAQPVSSDSSPIPNARPDLGRAGPHQAGTARIFIPPRR